MLTTYDLIEDAALFELIDLATTVINQHQRQLQELSQARVHMINALVKRGFTLREIGACVGLSTARVSQLLRHNAAKVAKRGKATS